MSVRKLVALAAFTFVAASLLGGSAIWFALGMRPSFEIHGRAPAKIPLPADLGQQWHAYGGDARGSRFSAATQITTKNVATLRKAWTFRSGVLRPHENNAEVLRRTAFEATPILVEDQLLLCTQFNQVIALDPESGRENWRFDPKVPTDIEPGNQYTCRGVSYWAGAEGRQPQSAKCASRVFLATNDAKLWALDPVSGEPCDEFGDDGHVVIEPSEQLNWPGEFSITSAPLVAGDLVVTGSAIADNVRTVAPLGTVHAFDVRSGQQRWKFNPVPRDPEDPARETWSGRSADEVGHANVWSTMSYDSERRLLFLPTSSPSPDYYGGNRAGRNDYANSVVALHAERGDVAWHFQTVHHDVWDYDVPGQPGLYDVVIDGTSRAVVAFATKTGFVFVLDRETGAPIHPVVEKPVPQGGVSGEQLATTQPFPAVTPSLIANTLDPSEAFGVTYWDRQLCAKKIKALHHEGLFTPPTEQGTLTYPFPGGGANWGGTAYDPSRSLMLVNMSNVASYVKLHKKVEDAPILENGPVEDGAEWAPMTGAPYSIERDPLLSPLGLPCSPPPWGILAAVNLETGKIVWRRTHGTTEDVAPGGLALRFGTPTLGGPMATAGGITFIGAAMDDYLRAYATESGEELWKGRLPAGGQATPMTYVYKGRQYVVIAAGGHGASGTKKGDYLVAFAL
ncbi:MAG: pyrroloquinoline quinone-dependent dehydrogenase [Pseudomonadota bacterium]